MLRIFIEATNDYGGAGTEVITRIVTDFVDSALYESLLRQALGTDLGLVEVGLVLDPVA